jgi:flagellin-like hook-associated protein FlgL
MTRVPTLASHDLMSIRAMSTQSKIYDLETQLSTKKKSQDYTGIASDALRLVNFENEANRTNTYITTNTVANTRLSAMNTAVTGARKSLVSFRDDLSSFLSNDLTSMDSTEVSDFEDLQSRAFNFMKDMEDYFDLKLDGEYVFAGGKSKEPPVDLGFDSLKDYQAVYDGNTILAPESRSAHMNDTVITSSGTGALTFSATDSFNNAATGGVSFDAANGNLVAANPGTFAGLKTGMSVSVSGSGTANDGTYTISGVSGDGTTLTLNPPLSVGGAGAAGTVISTANVGTISAATAGAFNLQSHDIVDTGGLTFNAANGTVAAATSGAFADIEAGSFIRVGDSGTANDGYYTVKSVSADGRTLTLEPNLAASGVGGADAVISVPAIQPGQITVTGSDNNARTFTVTDISTDGRTLTVSPPPTAETIPATGNAAISNDIYYKGGETSVEHRVSETRSIEFGINAKDGAVEKAFRAFGIVLQGMPTDSSGNVDGVELTRRLNKALDVANDAIEHETGNTTENTQDFGRLENQLASNQVVLKNALTNQKTYSSFLASRASDMENADLTEVATRINDESNALQYSYAAMSMINQMSLLNYMS